MTFYAIIRYSLNTTLLVHVRIKEIHTTSNFVTIVGLPETFHFTLHESLRFHTDLESEHLPEFLSLNL